MARCITTGHCRTLLLTLSMKPSWFQRRNVLAVVSSFTVCTKGINIVHRALFMPLVYSNCGYRLSVDHMLSHLSADEKFIFRVFKVNKIQVDDSTVKDYAKLLSYLVSIGCKAYELVEYPLILHLGKDEITKRLEALRSAGVLRVSVRFLRYAKPGKSSSQLRLEVRNYMSMNGGYVNNIDAVVNDLGCSSDQMMKMLTCNPRLIGRRFSHKDLVEKIQCLLEHGARKEDLWKSSWILTSMSLQKIQDRAKRLADLGYNAPLPIEVIHRNEKDFEAIVAHMTSDIGSKPLQNTVADIDQIIGRLPSMTAKNVLRAKVMIEYLLSKGFQPEEIISYPYVFQVHLSQVKSAIAELHTYFLDPLPLHFCIHFAIFNKFFSSRPSRQFRSYVRKTFGRDAAVGIPSNDQSVHLSSISYINANLLFLRDLGFSDKDIKQLPIILLHNPEQLRRHWNELVNPDSQLPVSIAFRQSSDQVKQLNILQYAVELSVSFRHVAVVSSLDEASSIDQAVAPKIQELPATTASVGELIDGELDGAFVEEDDDGDDVISDDEGSSTPTDSLHKISR